MAVSNPGYDLNTFEIHWSSLDSDARADLIARAGFFPPRTGILPVLKGLGSFHFSERTSARQSLDELVRAIQKKLAAPADSKAFAQGRQEACLVSARIYHQIMPDLSFADVSFFLTTLLNLGDKGAFFAFKALYRNRISRDAMKKSLQSVDEGQRLVFVDQYLQTSPAVRLRFAPLFAAILEEIKKRQPVVEFYAGLFDRKRDPDPFLHHLNQALRDPELILETEIASQSPELKILGLKALSMMTAKVPSPVLKKILETEEVKKVRLAVYSLVENSSMGLYADLFDPIFLHFKSSPKDEAIDAFRALVVTGRMPVHELAALIRRESPGFMPRIYQEISCLSRVSFFVIQDMALNKATYESENFDLNQACIFGMVKKRPERVIRILKAYGERAGKNQKMDVEGFIQTTTHLLAKERERIEAPFEGVMEALDKTSPGKSRGFLKSMLKDPLERKLAAFLAGTGSDPVDFQGDHLKDKNFSKGSFAAPPSFFVGTAFQDCDLSHGAFSNACFNCAVFYNVNMTGAVFDQIHFDHALFINVDAREARFHKCTFQGAGFYNCNFNDASLEDALFMEARIAKTAFARTDLTCACFAGADISGITFASANLNLADFTDVQARFSRFPSHVKSLVRAEGLDYNAREHQLGIRDLPEIDKSLVGEINMLIFCEFIHYGEDKFLNQNKLSLLTAFDMFRPAQAEFFQLLPLLLHENLGEPDQLPVSTPCGIAEYLPSKETLAVGEKYLGKRNLTARIHLSPYIQGVFSMGSVGSLAQTAESDIDYWVCIDERIMDKDGIGLLRRKLDSIEALAWDKFKIRVTFFLVDILKARNNDFGGSTQESSGSAQSRLLKEEFYRTMIHVAGKLPLWAVLPTSISINYYNLILDRISKMMPSHRYIDLGDIHAIPVNEFFGASIWQMFKWLKSPFKSVIKMALLEKYIQSYGQETLLCNQYKNEWMNSGTHLKPGQNDSYIVLLKTLIAFYNQSKDPKSANLLLTCFFLKLGLAKEADVDHTAFGMRRILLTTCLGEWGWTFQKIFEIGRFRLWPYAAIHRLSLTIERYMVLKYAKLQARFDTHSASGLMISEQDRLVLERKVKIVFQDKPNKIKQLLLVSRGDRHFSRLHLKYLSLPNRTGKWELVQKVQRQQQQVEESIITAQTIEEIGAWLINNHLYTDRTFLGLVPNPTSVSHDQIEKLYRAMYEFFGPEISKAVHFKELREQPIISRLFISMNFYAKKPQVRVTDYTVIYLNSWGEMYLRSSKPGISIPDADTAKAGILKGLSLKRFPRHTVLYIAGIMATP